MRIGELAERTGTSVRSIRYYEACGLLRSTRTGQGHRRFADSDVDRVIRIQEMLAGGLSTSTIRELLPCLDAPPSQRTGHLEVRLAEERRRLERQQREIARAQEVLDEILESVARSREPAGRDGP
ncbi:MerR family transcriptional regulator [Nocardioides sp.]|uniref:MerR family transcriptional regulator n=1 Tax=Nocardioides sp. TaxID=35761 RepID=UPI002ED7AE58